MMNDHGQENSLALRVHIISSSYPQHDKDWKSVFIKQLVYAISELPHIKLSYWGPFGELPDGVSYTAEKPVAEWLDSLMKRGGVIHLIRQGMAGLIEGGKLLLKLRKVYAKSDDVDIFHVNWLQNAIPMIGTKKPAIISVLGSDIGLLKVPGVVCLLRLVIKNRKCVIAPNAEWMIDPLVEKFGDVARISFVPLGIDKEWYEIERIIDRNQPHKWLMVTRLTRKKLGKIFEWGEDLFVKDSEQQLHLFGPMQEKIDIPGWVHYHGSTYPDELREKWIPTATGLVTLSEHDEGRPQIMLESMAAGLPIIASQIPAHENIISHRETGWIAGSPESMGSAIKWLSNSQNNMLMGSKARQSVMESAGTWYDCAKRYQSIYDNLREC